MSNIDAHFKSIDETLKKLEAKINPKTMSRHQSVVAAWGRIDKAIKKIEKMQAVLNTKNVNENLIHKALDGIRKTLVEK